MHALSFGGVNSALGCIHPPSNLSLACLLACLLLLKKRRKKSWNKYNISRTKRRSRITTTLDTGATVLISTFSLPFPPSIIARLLGGLKSCLLKVMNYESILTCLVCKCWLGLGRIHDFRQYDFLLCVGPCFSCIPTFNLIFRRWKQLYFLWLLPKIKLFRSQRHSFNRHHFPFPFLNFSTT